MGHGGTMEQTRYAHGEPMYIPYPSPADQKRIHDEIVLIRGKYVAEQGQSQRRITLVHIK